MKLLEKEKSPRVSFAASPDKTMESTPPPSPSHTDIRTDEDFVKSSSSKSPKKPLLVNKILCRVPSHDSNISDLSASLSPSYKKIENANNKESDNPIVALLNVCGAGEISALMTNSLAGGPANEASAKQTRRRDTTAVWGLAPSLEEDEDTLPPTSAGSTSNNTSIEYDNIELVLDESAFPPPPPPSSGRRSPFSGNGILKNKLSGMVNKSGRSSPKEDTNAPSVIISPEVKSMERSSPVENGRISHTYDVASFQNEMLRPTPVDLAVGQDHYMAASAAAAEVLLGERGNVRSSPVDSISGEVNMKPVVNGDKKAGKKSKSSKTSKASSVSRASVVSNGSKASSVTEMQSKDGEKAPAEPSRTFLKMPSFKRKNAKKKDETTATTKEEAPAAKENVENKTVDIKKKKSDDKTEATPPMTPTSETILDAIHWKATLDPTTSQTYYYHSQTKVTTWDKPEGFDEAQKIKDDAKLWKATVDPGTGKTYYYHGKTKEVRWTKPEGFVERRKKKKKKEESKSDEKVESEQDAVGKEVTAVTDEKPATSMEKTEVEKEASDSSPATPEGEVKDEQASNEPITDASTPTEPEDPTSAQPQILERVHSVEDAPFDEPIPARQSRELSPQDTTDDDTFGSLPSITNDIEPNMKPIDFNSRSKTFMSQMTDKTPRFNNTSASTARTRDFTNTQIDVNVTTDVRADGDEGHPSSLDSSLASADNSEMPTGKGVDPPAAGSTSAGAGNVVTMKNDSFDEEESAVFDDWSDEVSELSGIGNEERAAMKKLLVGRNAKKSHKSGRDTRVVSF